MSGFFASLLALVFVLFASVGVAAPQKEPPRPAPPTNDDCLTCHGDPSAARADGSPIHVDPEKLGASIHGAAGLACVDCHQDLAAAAEFPHADKLARATCTPCHDGPAAKFAASVHGSKAPWPTCAPCHGTRVPSPSSKRHLDDEGRTAVACADCHGTHDILPSSDKASRTYHLNLPDTCGACHIHSRVPEALPHSGREGGAGATTPVPTSDVVTLYKDSIHGRILKKSGLLVAPNCKTCHGAHDVVRVADEASRANRKNVPSTCGACHEGILQQYESGVHGKALAGGNPNAPVCTTCHTAHHISSAEKESWRVDVVRECGTCHPQSLGTYRDTYHGQVTNLGFARVATCADCHEAHDIRPKDDPLSTVSAEGRVKTCQKCHAGAGARFALYDPHADPHDAERNPLLHLTSRFMKSLLYFVFAFFGLHTALWLPRSWKARRERKSHA